MDKKDVLWWREYNCVSDVCVFKARDFKNRLVELLGEDRIFPMISDRIINLQPLLPSDLHTVDNYLNCLDLDTRRDWSINIAIDYPIIKSPKKQNVHDPIFRVSICDYNSKDSSPFQLRLYYYKGNRNLGKPNCYHAASGIGQTKTEEMCWAYEGPNKIDSYRETLRKVQEFSDSYKFTDRRKAVLRSQTSKNVRGKR